jgi:hypothetical protein
MTGRQRAKAEEARQQRKSAVSGTVTERESGIYSIGVSIIRGTLLAKVMALNEQSILNKEPARMGRTWSHLLRGWFT